MSDPVPSNKRIKDRKKDANTKSRQIYFDHEKFRVKINFPSNYTTGVEQPILLHPRQNLSFEFISGKMASSFNLQALYITK